MVLQARVTAIVAVAVGLVLIGCDDPKANAGSAASSAAPQAASAPKPSAAPAPSASVTASAEPAGMTPDKFCHEVYGAVAAKFASSCSEEDKKSSGYALAAAFAQMPFEECSFVVRDGAIAGRLAFDAAVADKCVAAAAAHAKSPAGLHFAVPDVDEMPECKGLVAGKQDEGQACKTSIECKGDLTCIGAHHKQDGACKKVPTKAGEACDGSLFRMHDLGHKSKCGPGLECDLPDQKNASPVCKAAKAAGAACVESDECAGDLWCKAGKCDSGPPGDVGAACADDADDCKDGLFCERTKKADKLGKCAAKRAAGQPCGDVFECRGECKKPEGKDTGTCAAICGSG
jgi:hypothetical protein